MQKRHSLIVLALTLLACQGCWTRTKSSPDGGHGKVASIAETRAASKEITEAQNKAYAAGPLALAPPPCNTEIKKAEALMRTDPAGPETAEANLAVMNCSLKLSNAARCKGKPQPCGLVPFNPPIKANEPAPPAQLVDVSVPSQVTDACAAIGAAAGVALTGGMDAAVGVTLGSVAGNYSCGAYFQAAARSDPILLIAPQFVPTVQLTRDLKQITGGTVDLTPEEAAKNVTQAVQRSVITVKVAGVDLPVAALPIIPVGGTPGQILNQGAGAIQQGVNHLGDEVGRQCKNLLGIICH